MELGTPTKPPRGVKQYKEPSGLLMSVIRTLSKSETDEQRDKQKGRLEKDYRDSNSKLEDLVSTHDLQLTQVMQLFVKVSTQITASREKIRAVKTNLQSCKSLLRYRRDELKKLWLEGIEHKHSLQLLEEIDQLREVPSQLGTYLSKKQYLHATQLLMSALSLGDGSLEGVEALTDVRNELRLKKEMLHAKLMEELKEQLYVLPTQDALVHFRRQGSGSFLSPFQRGGAPGELRGSNRSSRARRKLLDVPRGLELEQDLLDGGDEADSEERSEHFTGVVVECLGLLHKIPDAVETIKEEMQSELLAIISRTTKAIVDASFSSAPLEGARGVAPLPLSPRKPLLDLLETVFDQLRRVAAAHVVSLRCFNKVADKYRIVVKLYEMQDVWSKIQAVLQQMLTDYLDVSNLSGASLQAPSYVEPAADISSFFSRRKQQRQKRVHLFRFDYSSHSLGMTLEGAGVDKGSGKTPRDKTLVCPSDMRNVTILYIPVSRFVQEIEQALNASPCTLNSFLADYVRNVFVEREYQKVSGAVEAATKSPEAWKAVVGAEIAKKLSLPRPLLQSTVSVERSIAELRDLMRSLPSFADRLLSIVSTSLKHYLETCQAAYRGIVQPDSEDKRICSAAWLKDDDISRFIKSLPNWMELQAHKPTHRRGRAIRREETTEEESPEDIRQRNVKEAEILASNMGEGGISAHEILSDVGQLKKLAQLHESMEWFAAQVLSVTSDVSFVNDHTSPEHQSASSPASPTSRRGIPEQAVQSLYELVHGFTNLADICLLVLHLEVRVQCFHYLLPKSENRSKQYDFLNQEPDHNVLELSRVLTNIDEAMVSSIQPRKAKYIFEGLGHLIAKILISSSQYMTVIDETGIQRMHRNVFHLQQSLTNITASREVALDHAKQFYEMFYRTPDEILGSVLDKGPQFTDMEYMNALHLLVRSYPKHGSVEKYLKRLSDILGEIGVTV